MTKPRRTALLLLLATAALGGTAYLLLSGPTPDVGTSAGADAASRPPAGTPDAAPRAPVTRSADEVAAAAAPGFYGAPVGSRFRYSLQARLESAARRLLPDGVPGEPTGVAYDAAGTVEMIVVERDDARIVVAFACPDTTFAVTAPGGLDTSGAAREMTTMLAETAFVALGHDGEVLGFQFPADAPDAHERWVRSLVASLRGVVREDESRYAVAEADTTGTAEHTYTWAGDDTLRRARGAYTEVNGGDAAAVEGEANGTLTVDRALAWPRAATWDERTAMTIAEAEMQATIALRARIELVANDRVAAGELPRPDARGFAPATYSVDEAVARAAADQQQLDRYAALLEDVGVAQLVAEIRALLANEGFTSEQLFEAARRLAMKLRLEPEAIATLLPEIVALQGDVDLANVLLAAVGNAQVPEAQAALAQVLADTSHGNELRLSAAFAMAQVRTPQPALVESIAAGAERAVAADATTLDDAQLMLLGSLGAGDGEGAVLARRSLLAMESKAVENGRVAAWLRAAVNSGQADLAARAVAYADHPSNDVRHAAVDALALADTPEAAARLDVLATVDRDPRVRASALAALGRRGDADGLESVTETLQGEADPQVRRVGIQALASRQDAAGRAALRRVLQNERDAELRAEIQSYLQR